MDLDQHERRRLDLRRAYDQDAARRSSNEPEPWRLQIVDDLAERIAAGAAGRRVVDLGCGAGQMAAHLVSHDIEVVAVDLSPAMATRTRERGVASVVADLGRLPFADGTFAGALAFNSFLHTPRSGFAALMTEVRRVLAPEAPLTVVVWGGETREGPLDDDWLDPPRFFSLLSDEDLVRVPVPGFRRVETRLLHEEASHGLHPQVLTLVAESP
jgi:SAM-dependent methyltransferase